ncbi:MAG: PAS domain S-box protein, partial [Elusimicrobiota bacterium]|nr:PAS domain S-box protein [Elusimicrobiota bacterium]
PALPLGARKAFNALSSYVFEQEINFDRLKQSVNGINKSGAMQMQVIMTPINERELASGKITADYLLEINPLDKDSLTSQAKTGVMNEDILAYQDAVLLVSREGLVLRANNFALELLGRSLEEVQARPLLSFIVEEDAQALTSDIEEIYSQGFIKSRNYSLKAKGALLPIEAAAALARNNNFLFSFRNISARNQLIDLLRERSQYAIALSNVVDGALLECDIQNNTFSNFTNANDAASDLIGLSKDEILTLNLAALLTDKEQKEKQKVKKYLAAKIEQLKKDKVIYFEAKIEPENRPLFVSIRISYFEILGRKKAIIVLRDSTKERYLEGELNYRNRELNGIKEALGGLYVKVNSKGIIQEYKTTDMSYNISVFPSDFVGKDPKEYLAEDTAASLKASLEEALKTGEAVRTSFSMQYGNEYRFYETTITPIKGEDNAILLINSVDKRKGLENRIHDLYAISSKHEGSFVEKMNDVLEFGKQIFGAQIGLICHFSGQNRERILINYATKNDFNIHKDMEGKAQECFAGVRNGEIVACKNTAELNCDNCLHLDKKITAFIAAPLSMGGKVEGAICFANVGGKAMQLTDDDKDFMGFVGGLMSMALELRQAKKAVDGGISTLKHLADSLDLPSVILDTNLRIQNANNVLRGLCGIYDMVEVEDYNFFSKLTFDSTNAERDFRDAYKTSANGAFDFTCDLNITEGRRLNLLWHVVEIKDIKGQVRGFLLVSESIKDLPALRGVLYGPNSHI